MYSYTVERYQTTSLDDMYSILHTDLAHLPSIFIVSAIASLGFSFLKRLSIINGIIELVVLFVTAIGLAGGRRRCG